LCSNSIDEVPEDKKKVKAIKEVRLWRKQTWGERKEGAVVVEGRSLLECFASRRVVNNRVPE